MDFLNQDGVRFTLGVASQIPANKLEEMIDEIDQDVLTNGEPEEVGLWFTSVAREAMLLELAYKRPAATKEDE